MKLLAMTMVLAAMDSMWVYNVQSAAQWIISAVFGYWLYQMRQDKAKLETTAADLIEAKFQSYSTGLVGKMDMLNLQLGHLNEKLDQRDDDFRNLGASDNGLRVQLAEQTGQIKTYIAEKFATREELAQLRDDMRRDS